MKKVIFYTQAYNSEKHIKKCIESVLNQTYKDFCYYIVDNGSIDNTKKIIEEYSNKDNRIIPLFEKSNRIGRIFKIIEEITSEKNMPKKSYLATLDADDEYTPDFFEKMIDFIQENNLEVATCGTDWINQKTGDLIKRKVLDKNITLEGQDFAEQFPIYRNFMVTIWGGVYSLDLLQRCDFNGIKNGMNFGDTAFCMETFRRARRAGILSESLHKYYISSKTVSYKYNPDWFQACKYLHKISKEYLLEYGEISKENEDYLYTLFFILIKYILPRIQQADVNLYDKLKSLHEIFADDLTEYILIHWEKLGIYSKKSDFLREVEEWIYNQDGWERYRQTVEKIITAMNA